MNSEKIIQTLDHAILHPTTTDKDLIREINKLDEYPIASFCVPPCQVKLAAQESKKTPICTVIGFPHGNTSTQTKAAESIQAIQDGAQELDMVLNIGKALSEDWRTVSNEIETISEISQKNQKILKVIFETDFLNGKEIYLRNLCKICSDLGVDFIKTSTGFGYTKQKSGDYNYIGATEETIKRMIQYSSSAMKIKASGGIRTAKDAATFIQLGCSRIGTGSSLKIIGELMGTKQRVELETNY